MRHKEGSFKGQERLQHLLPALATGGCATGHPPWSRTASASKRPLPEPGRVLRAARLLGLRARSPRPRKVRRRTVQVEATTTTSADLKTFFDLIRKEKPGEDIFLIGHSMGASIATAYAAQYQGELAGLVAVGRRHRDRQGAAASRGPRARRHAVARSCRGRGLPQRPAGLSRSATGGSRFRHGPDARRSAGDRRAPYTADPGHGRRRVAAGRRPAQRGPVRDVASRDKTLKLYPDLLHEIFNEPEWPDVMTDLEAWLDKHI